jgi:hypothetical protein
LWLQQSSSDLQAVHHRRNKFAFTMLAMTVIDRIGRKTLLLIGSVSTAACLGGVAAVFFTESSRSFYGYLLAILRFCLFSGCRHLGSLSVRSFPIGQGRRDRAWAAFTLVHERTYFRKLSSSGCLLWRPFVFFSISGPAIFVVLFIKQGVTSHEKWGSVRQGRKKWHGE